MCTSVAIGNEALSSNNTGNQNIAIGAYALINTTGSGNVAIGANSLYNSSGNYNLGLGNSAGENLQVLL